MAAKFVDESSSVLRFSDFTVQPRRMLPPIMGYENQPLVSLEEAVEPLTSLVPEVERMAWTVKQNHFEGEHDLTHDESASILLYTMEWQPKNKSFYVILNNTLQSANRNLLKPWFLYLRLIMTSLSKLPSNAHPVTVYRGVKLDLSAQYPKGSTVTWWGLSSCTTDIGVLSNEEFLGRSGTRTIFTIECESAKSIKSFSFFPEEEEVLLPPARQFYVAGCLNSGNDLHIIQLKEIQPKFPLINLLPSSQNPLVLTVESPPKPLTSPVKQTPKPSTSPVEPPPKPLTPTVEPSPKPLTSPVKQTSKPLTSLVKQTPKPLASSVKQTPKPSSSPVEPPPKPLTPPKCGNPKLQTYIDALYLDPALTTLNLYNKQIGPQGAKDLGSALQINKTLITLNLQGNEIGDQGAKGLGSALQINKTLTTLNLQGNQIGPRGAKDLGSALQINKTLITFNLGVNEIGDQGAKDLGSALQINKTLITLNLDNNQIGPQGAKDLGSALQINKTLTTLHLQDNKIDHNVRDEILKIAKMNTGLIVSI